MDLLEKAGAARGPTDPLWISERGVRTSETLAAATRRSAGARRALAGRDVVVAVRSPDLLLATCAVLDGCAATLILVPHGLDPPVDAWPCDAPAVVTDEIVADGGAAAVADYVNGIPGLTLVGPATRDPDGAQAATAWVLATSGTTGEPKLVSHSFESLTRTVSARAAGYRWGLLYDASRFAGLQVVLQSLLSQSILILPDRARPFAAQVEFLAEHHCDALSATATLWRKLLMVPGARALALRQVTLGGEIADRMVLEALAAAFPAARITQIYASTEAGVGFAVHDGREGFPVSYLSRPPGGVQLAVNDTGRLLMRLPVKGAAYLDGTPLVDAEGWIDTGDQIRVEGDRCIFQGRAGGVISVGGDQVFPEEVEAVVHEVPGVAGCTVSGRESSLAGALVAVAVVSDGTRDADELRAAIRRHCREALPRHKVPAVVTLTDDLAVSAAGKAARRS